MKVKREVAASHQAWREAARELDTAIGIELDAEADARTPAAEIMDIRRFRQAVLAERQARMRYVAALKSDNKPIPDELVWDVPEDGQRENWSRPAG